jgi:hypothetical protein
MLGSLHEVRQPGFYRAATADALGANLGKAEPKPTSAQSNVGVLGTGLTEPFNTVTVPSWDVEKV